MPKLPNGASVQRTADQASTISCEVSDDLEESKNVPENEALEIGNEKTVPSPGDFRCTRILTPSPKRVRICDAPVDEDSGGTCSLPRTSGAIFSRANSVSMYIVSQSGLGQRAARQASRSGNMANKQPQIGCSDSSRFGFDPMGWRRSCSNFAPSRTTRDSRSNLAFSFQSRSCSTCRSLLGLGQIGNFTGAPSTARTIAKFRAVFVALTCLVVILMPLTRYDMGSWLDCSRSRKTKVTMTVDTVLLCILTLLIVLLELRWWRTSPTILVIRWHVLANGAIAILTTWMGSWNRSDCGEETWVYNIGIWYAILALQWCTFIWNDDLVCERIVKLEDASGQNLGSVWLRWLIRINLVLTVFSVVFAGIMYAVVGHVSIIRLQPMALALSWFILVSVVASMACAINAFYAALRLSQQELKECNDQPEHDIAKYAVRVARRHLVGVAISMGMELPVAICEIVAAFGNNFDRADVALHATVIVNATCNVICMALLSGLLDSGDILSIAMSKNFGKFWTKLFKRKGDKMKSLADWSTGDSEWDDEVKKLTKRGFELRALLKFYATLGTPNGPMPHFQPNAHTTTDVVRQAVIPLSRNTKFGNCALATVMMKGKDVLPSKLVTHTWRSLFSHLVAAIVADALHVPMYEHILKRLVPGELNSLISELYWKGKLSSTYWVCAFSINQHASVCHLPGGKDSVTGEEHPQCSCNAQKHDGSGPRNKLDGRVVRSEINKFDSMVDCLADVMRGQFGQVIAVDARFELFNRAWCIAEIFNAQKRKLNQTLVLLSEQVWEEKRKCQSLRKLKVEDMDATNLEDKVAILSTIPDKAAFNKELQRMVFDEKGLLRAWQDGLDFMSMLGKVIKMSANNQGSPNQNRNTSSS